MQLFKKKHFFGWANFRFLIKEFVKMLSGEESFFSQKRFQQFTAFMILSWGCVYYLLQHAQEMKATDFLVWSSIPGAVAGYALYHVQKQKKTDQQTDKPKYGNKRPQLYR